MNLVFTGALGGHLCSDTVYGNFKRIAEKIGIPAARFHDLRHTFATLPVQNGDDIKTVSENLGYATTAFTLGVYGHVTEKMKQDSAKRSRRSSTRPRHKKGPGRICRGFCCENACSGDRRFVPVRVK